MSARRTPCLSCSTPVKSVLCVKCRTLAVRRVTRWVRSATPDQVAAGIGWYEHALEVCVMIATINAPGMIPVAVDAVAGTFAAYSPRCQVSTNIAWCAATIHAARTGQACPEVHTRTMRRQAWAIAQGASWQDVLRGPKVRAFAANILGDTDQVTVDVWAVRAALGPAACPAGRITARQYAAIAEVYQRAARRLGMSPRDTQAAAWMAVRGVKPTDREFHAAAAERAA